jgi:[acyl-carrier-protein] S-malonyltransferase
MAMDASPASAILFPGQGVGDASHRALVAETRPDLLELAGELIGEDPFARIAEGTVYAQPAVYCASLAGYERLDRPGGEYFAGHSLGEITALAAAGALDEAEGLRLVIARGRAMEDAAAAAEPGGMLAVGSDRDSAELLARENGLILANENSPEQFVLSGPEPGIERAKQDAKARGLRAKRLAVSGAFHSTAMERAVPAFRAALDAVDFHEPTVPVISSTSAEPFSGDVRPSLGGALVSPVRWTETLARLRGLGVTRFVDVGPGKVLAGLVRRTLVDPQVEAVTFQEAALA